MAIVQCKICGSDFYIKPSHLKLGWGKYCSKKCQGKSQLKGRSLNCAVCDKVFYRSPTQLKRSDSGKYFCTKSCQTCWRNSHFIEEKHPNWRGGESVYRDILKRTGVKAVCVCCKTSDERVLSAHHIDHNRHNNDKSNLVWVCFNCHFLIHHDKKFKEDFLKNNVKS